MKDFHSTRVVLDPNLVSEHLREALRQLPSMIHLHGDAVPLDYAIEDGVGVVRLRLREGQAHQLQARDVPEFDRPVRFTVVRGGEEALRAPTLAELKTMLKGIAHGRTGKREKKHGRHPQRHQRRRRD